MQTRAEAQKKAVKIITSIVEKGPAHTRKKLNVRGKCVKTF